MYPKFIECVWITNRSNYLRSREFTIWFSIAKLKISSEIKRCVNWQIHPPSHTSSLSFSLSSCLSCNLSPFLLSPPPTLSLSLVKIHVNWILWNWNHFKRELYPNTRFEIYENLQSLRIQSPYILNSWILNLHIQTKLESSYFIGQITLFI